MVSYIERRKEGKLMYHREAMNTIKNISDTFKVLLVTGPRQVEKNFVIKFKTRKYGIYYTR